MPKQEEVARILADHEHRLVKLESVIARPSPLRKKPREGVRVTLPEHIIQLRDSSTFFAQPRTADDVHKKLMPTYHCEVDRVAMALLRLRSKKELRKATKIVNGRRYQAYVW